jgi:hypothetical protein
MAANQTVREHVYDAVSVLGFGRPCDAAAFPPGKPGELIVRYGGWSLQQLRDIAIVRRERIMSVHHWYDRYAWSVTALRCGFYGIRMPVPGSNAESGYTEYRILSAEEQPCYACLVGTALLTHRLVMGESLCPDQWLRCGERARGGYRMAAWWMREKLTFTPVEPDLLVDTVWTAAMRFIAPCRTAF